MPGRNTEPNYTLKLTLAEAAEIAKLVSERKETLEAVLIAAPEAESAEETKVEYAVVERLYHRL